MTRVRLVALVALVLSPLAPVACTRAEQIQAANAQRSAGFASNEVLLQYCNYVEVEKIPDVSKREGEVSRLTMLGCETAWNAQKAFSHAHAAQVDAIRAAERGECMIGTPKSAPACDLLRAAENTYKAATELTRAITAVQAAVSSAKR